MPKASYGVARVSNRSKMASKWPVEGSEGGPWRHRAANTRKGWRGSVFWKPLGAVLGAPWGSSWGLLGPSWPSWRPLHPVLGPSWRPKSDLKSLPKAIILWITFLINFSIDFGSIFDRFSTSWGMKNMQKPLVFVGQNKEACFYAMIALMIGFGSNFGPVLGAKLGWKREPRQAKTGQDRPRQSKISQVKLSQVVDVKSAVNYKEKCSPAARRQHFC